MADLAAAHLPGVLEQIWLIAGVRWRILKNSLRRKHNVADLIGMIWVAFISACLVIGVSFAFFAGGYEFAHKSRLEWFVLLYWVIFLWWQFVPIFMAGFGSNFEFATLLRFPLSLRAFYLLGLGYGFSDLAALSSTCWVIAMIAGTGTARPSLVPVMVMASVPFVLLNVTMERLVGSWLEKILAKRKTREIFIGIFILCMVSLNFLNPAFYHGTRPVAILHYLPYLAWLPGSLAGDSILSASFSDQRGMLLQVGGLIGWAAVLSVLLWRRYAAQYSGEEISDSPGPVILRRREKKQALGAETPSLFGPQVGAVIAKEFRYLTRNGMAFLSLIIPPLMVVFFTMQFGPNSPLKLKHHPLDPGIFVPGILGYLLLILVSPAYNSFAFEGKGIQTYFMAPVRFRDVLLGKNLFLAALVALELGLALGMLTYRVGWPGTPRFLATITAGAFALIGQLAIANWSSLSFPKKMEIGKMKGQRNAGVAVWVAFGVQILIGCICAVILMAGKWTGNPWLPVVVFAALTAAVAGGYVSSLRAMDALAESKKELLIEALSK
jgi:ABC-2 type transport system permease protein